MYLFKNKNVSLEIEVEKYGEMKRYVVFVICC